MSLFGQKPAAATSIFGAAPSAGLFGGAAAPAYGAPAAQSTFGAAPATPAFGGAAPAATSLFGATPSAAPSFGAAPATPSYPAYPTSSPFGSTSSAVPGFGAPTASAFGGAPSVAPGFGASAFGAAPAAATPFGAAAAAPASAFGAAAAAPGAGFPFGAKPAAAPFGGAPAFGQQTPGLFGAATATPAFGTAASSFGGASTGAGGLFGAAPAAASAPPGSYLFPSAAGAAPATPFGAPTAATSAFGTPGAGSVFGGTAAAAGGVLTWQPVTETEQNNNQTVQVKLQSITAMPQAHHLSVEELRWADYQGGRRSAQGGLGAAGGIFGAAPAAPSAYGAPAVASPFGAPTAAPSVFGAAPATGSLFGVAAPAAAPAFGQAAPGAAPTSIFGAAPTAPAAGSMFGAATAAAPAFAGATPSIFGQPTAAATAPSSSIFGATPAAAPAAAPFGAGLTGGLGFPSLGAPAASTPAPLTFPGLGAPATAAPMFSSLTPPSYAAQTPAAASSIFSTPAPMPQLSYPGAANTSILSTFPSSASWPTTVPGAAAAAATTTNPYAALGQQVEVRLGTPGAFGALPAVATSLTVPSSLPTTVAASSTSNSAATPVKKPLPPLVRLTPSSAAKVKPRTGARTASFVYDSFADPSAAPIPEAFAPRSDLRRLILEPEDQPAPPRPLNNALPAASPSQVTAAASPPASVATSHPPSSNAPQQQQPPSPGLVKPKPMRPEVMPAPTSSEPPTSSPHPHNGGSPLPAINDPTPVLTRPDYYTEPAIELLQRWSDDELRRVKGFAVGRTGVGRVAFDGDTDVRYLNLDDLVHFSEQPREIEVYPEGVEKPDVGRGLNKPATVTLEACFPAARPGAASSTDPERLAAYEERLRKFTASIDAQFVSYDRYTGRWTFKVKHFSKYGTGGLDDDDEDEAGDPQALQGKRAAAPPSAAAAATAKGPVKPLAVLPIVGAAGVSKPSAVRAPALSIDAQPVEGEADVIRQRAPLRQPLRPAEAEDEEEQQQQHDDHEMDAGEEEDEEPEEVEAIAPLGTSIDYPEDADFEEPDMEGDLEPPSRRRVVDALRVQQMRASFFSTAPADDDADVDDDSFLDDVDGVPEMDMTLPRPPPVLSLLPTSLFPPRAPERPPASLQILPAASGAVRLREKERVQLQLPARTSTEWPKGNQLMARSFRVAWGPRGMLAVPRVSSSLSRVELQQVSAGAPLVPPVAPRPPRSLPFAAPPLTVSPQPIPDEVIAKYVPMLEAHRSHSSSLPSPNTTGHPPQLILSSPDQFLEAAINQLASLTSPEDAYSRLLWQLVRALFVPLPAAPPHAMALQRRRNLGDWLAQAVSDKVEAAVRAAQSGTNGEVVFARLTGRQLSAAASECVRAKDLRLATLVAQALSDDIRADVQAQLNSMEAYPLQSYRRKVYSLLAGDLRADLIKDLDWMRAFATHLWYRSPNAEHLHPSTEPLSAVLHSYASALKARRAPVPLPPYVADDLAPQRTRFAAEKPPPQANEIEASRNALDTLYLLLCLFADTAFPLARVISPLGHTPRALDYRLSWQLFSVLQALSFSPVPASLDASYARIHQIARVHDLQWVHGVAASFASQLETAGLWHWAVYVLLHLPATEYSAPLKNSALRHTIARNVRLGGNDHPLSAEEQFIVHLGVPTSWLHEARAWAAKAAFDPRAEYDELLAAQRPAEAHAVLAAHVAPAVLLDLCSAQMSKEELLAALHDLNEKFGASGEWPREWRTGGGLYFEYLKIRKAQEDWRSSLREGHLDGEEFRARQANLHRLVLHALRTLHGLDPAPQPKGQAATAEQGIAWIEMATVLAELLVRLLESSEQRRHALRTEITPLPLTENHRHNLLHLCVGPYVGVC